MILWIVLELTDLVMFVIGRFLPTYHDCLMEIRFRLLLCYVVHNRGQSTQILNVTQFLKVPFKFRQSWIDLQSVHGNNTKVSIIDFAKWLRLNCFFLGGGRGGGGSIIEVTPYVPSSLGFPISPIRSVTWDISLFYSSFKFCHILL